MCIVYTQYQQVTCDEHVVDGRRYRQTSRMNNSVLLSLVLWSASASSFVVHFYETIRKQLKLWQSSKRSISTINSKVPDYLVCQNQNKILIRTLLMICTVITYLYRNHTTSSDTGIVSYQTEMVFILMGFRLTAPTVAQTQFSVVNRDSDKIFYHTNTTIWNKNLCIFDC